MTSHHQPSNVVKFPPIGECDYDERVYRIPSRDDRPNPWNDARSYLPNLEDQLEASWAMPLARATRLSARARLRGLVHAASVAIAVVTALYFIAEFLR